MLTGTICIVPSFLMQGLRVCRPRCKPNQSRVRNAPCKVPLVLSKHRVIHGSSDRIDSTQWHTTDIDYEGWPTRLLVNGYLAAIFFCKMGHMDAGD